MSVFEQVELLNINKIFRTHDGLSTPEWHVGTVEMERTFQGVCIVLGQLDPDDFPIGEQRSQEGEGRGRCSRHLQVLPLVLTCNADDNGIIQYYGISTLELNATRQFLPGNALQQGSDTLSLVLSLLNGPRANEDVVDDQTDIPCKDLLRIR